MKILIIDVEELALSVAMRFLEAGHDVTLYQHTKDGEFSTIGEGLVRQTKDWKKEMDWADLVMVTTNVMFLKDLQPYFDQGYPIIGPNQAAAELELNRGCGQDVFEGVGIETLPYEIFSSYEKAIAHVKKTGLRYVSKPWGGNPDKSLSYVSKEPADMVVKLERWKEQGKLKGEFILQEVMDGVEMAVGGWFGPGGWNKYWNENWEEKRLFNEGLGPNTGESGTIMRYTKRSKLADEILLPVTSVLEELSYVGYCDVNCIVGADGTPWPLEFTMRFGWPHFQFAMNLHEGDPAEWMLDLVEGRDSLECSLDIALGVVLAQGDYPWSKMHTEDISGFPIKGLTKGNKDRVHLNNAKWGKSALQVGEEIVTAHGYVTAGDYVATVVGLGHTVKRAQKEAYKLAHEITWANDPFYRTDIGERLKEELPVLQKLGFAKGIVYG